jgi:Putative stress-induced transcription regulator/CGNR zinc finger
VAVDAYDVTGTVFVGLVDVQQPGDPVGVAVDLANTWDSLEAEPERLRRVDDLRELLVRHGIGGDAASVGERDLARARALRDDVRAVFLESDEREAAARINTLLEDSNAVPRLVSDGGAWTLRHRPGHVGPVGRLAAAAATALAEVVSSVGWERIGVCDADPCRAVFVDRTRSGNRRYCSRLCADRMATAAYRERRRGGGG